MTTTPDIDRIRERWARNYVNPWEARPDVGTLLAAVDERDRRIAAARAAIGSIEERFDEDGHWLADVDGMAILRALNGEVSR